MAIGVASPVSAAITNPAAIIIFQRPGGSAQILFLGVSATQIKRVAPAVDFMALNASVGLCPWKLDTNLLKPEVCRVVSIFG